MRSKLSLALALASALLLAGTAQALPVLGTGAGTWSYDASSHSWATPDAPFQLATSNGSSAGTGFLTVTGLTASGPGGRFSLSISNEGSALTRVAGGTLFGVYFQVYRFSFDTPLSGLAGGSGGGYAELLDVAVHSLGAGVRGLTFLVASNTAGLGNLLKVKLARDAGFVPEPGAVGVFSMGLLVAGALIRRLRTPR
jgi:hypothetical protein